MGGKPKAIGVRMAEEDVNKLDMLARKTERTRSQVLRLLLQRAELLGDEIRSGLKRLEGDEK